MILTNYRFDMTKIEQIQYAIHEANFFRSKLSPEALAVPGMTSLKIRALMNNLGAISTNFLEIGSHAGGTFCSTIYGNDNLKGITSIDNFSEFNTDSPMQQLLDNVSKFKPKETQFKLIMKDCWGPIEQPPSNVDFFMFDGDHSFESQKNAMTHFIPWMAEEFVFCVDDASVWPFVKAGMEEGIALSELRYKIKGGMPGYKILFEQELWDGQEGNNYGWHMGFWVALCSRI